MAKFTILNNLDDPRIIPFLITDERSSVYHHPAWIKAIARAFNHNAFYLFLEESDGTIKGLFPFITIDSSFTGKRIVSVPFSAYCDPLLPEEIIRESITYLQTAFKDFKGIEIRTKTELKSEPSNFSKNNNYVTNVIQLQDNIEDTLKSMHRTSVRPFIRRAENKNLDVRYGNSENDLRIFYKYEVSLRKRLSYPPLPYNLYLEVWQELKKHDMILLPIIENMGNTIAAGFVLRFKNIYYLEYAAADNNYFDLYPVHKLYWEIIKLAQTNGVKYVDFGRSSKSNESLIAFKDRWNSIRYNLYYYYYPSQSYHLTKSSGLENLLKLINSKMPKKLLELEGRIIYPHLS